MIASATYNSHALNQALLLASQGTPCFPCSENKRPTCPNGFKAATKDLSILRELWERHPGPQIGVPAGAAIGIDILDIDPQNSGHEWWNKVNQSIPPTQTHRTRSGGLHILFKHSEGVRNSAGTIAKGVDVRGDGGYIIWWPAFGLEVFNQNMLAEWPEWLINVIKPSSSKVISTVKRPSKYIQEVLQKAEAAVVNAPEGRRNHQLNAEVYLLGRFIQSGQICPRQVASALSRAGLSAGLSRTEIINTIASALRAQGV